MGKGDKRTKKGEIKAGSYGKTRRPKSGEIKPPRKHPTSYAPSE